MALLTVSFYSHCLERTVDLRALIPLDGQDKPLDAPQQPLKALILLHGLYGSENDWLTYTRAAAYARAHDLALLCPAGENSFYTDPAQGRAQYLRYVGEELPRLARRLFPLSEKREDLFIGGLSMGGFGALNAGFTYPETFSRVIALSPALDPWTRMLAGGEDRAQSRRSVLALFGDNPFEWDPSVRAMRCEPALLPKVWLGCGAEDPLCPKSEAFAAVAGERGWPVTFEKTPGGHNWDYWDSAIRRGIDWLMNEEEQA